MLPALASPSSASSSCSLPAAAGGVIDFFLFRLFGGRIVLILFCLRNPDCYHLTNYSHIFLQTANGRDKAAAGLCDFCLSNYCNYLKNGLKLYGVMNLIMSLQSSLVLHAACKWASLPEALCRLTAGGDEGKLPDGAGAMQGTRACSAGGWTSPPRCPTRLFTQMS